jgi:hypothetical protein
MQLSFDGFGCTEIDHQQILISDRMRFAYFGSRLVYSSAGRRYSINVIESEVSRRGVWLEAWVAEFGHLTGGGSQQGWRGASGGALHFSIRHIGRVAASRD